MPEAKDGKSFAQVLREARQALLSVQGHCGEGGAWWSDFANMIAEVEQMIRAWCARPGHQDEPGQSKDGPGQSKDGPSAAQLIVDGMATLARREARQVVAQELANKNIEVHIHQRIDDPEAAQRAVDEILRRIRQEA